MKLTWHQSKQLRLIVKDSLNRAEMSRSRSTSADERAFYDRVVSEQSALLAAMGSERIEFEMTPEDEDDDGDA